MSTKKFIYPHNLRATANLWLWSLRDFTILCIAALLSAVSLVTIGFVVPAAATLSFGFLTIRRDERTVLFVRKNARKNPLSASPRRNCWEPSILRGTA